VARKNAETGRDLQMGDHRVESIRDCHCGRPVSFQPLWECFRLSHNLFFGEQDVTVGK
jgi:hypothetical protein